MRPDWDTYFREIAELAATRSQCHSIQVGAVIVREKHIIATGYNGVPSGIEPCAGCRRKYYNRGYGYDVCPAVHAEANAIAQAAKLGISTLGATMYCTKASCKDCIGLIINAGLRTLVAPSLKGNTLAHKLLAESGMGMVILN